MPIKIIGAILIIASTTLYGFVRAGIPDKRHKSLIMIASALELLENEIMFTSDYIDNVFLRIAKLIDSDCLFKTTVSLQEDISAGIRWKKAVLADKDKLCLKNEDCEIISLLASNLGMCDKEGQIKNIQHVKALLQKQINLADEENKKSAKLYKSLGISAGIFAAIILF